MGHTLRCAVAPKDVETAEDLLCLLQSLPRQPSAGSNAGCRPCCGARFVTTSSTKRPLSSAWMRTHHIVQLLLSTQGAVSMPGTVFVALVSNQLDKGATQLMGACRVSACEYPQAAGFPPTLFHVLPRGLQRPNHCSVEYLHLQTHLIDLYLGASP